MVTGFHLRRVFHIRAELTVDNGQSCDGRVQGRAQYCRLRATLSAGSLTVNSKVRIYVPTYLFAYVDIYMHTHNINYN